MISDHLACLQQESCSFSLPRLFHVPDVSFFSYLSWVFSTVKRPTQPTGKEDLTGSRKGARMKSFLLVVNILALTLPCLAAEVPKQEQAACPENDARLFDQKTMPYTLLPLVLNSYPAFKPSYYPYYPVMSMNNPYMSHKVYKNPVVFRSLAHIPHWTQMPYIYLPPMVHYPTSHPQLKGMSLKKIPTKTNTPTINTIASVEPTPIPNIEPMVNTPVVTPETSSEFIIKNTPETTTVPVSSPTA
ncbi:kappa-casein [Tupaia chinensis]|uniref:kappa-casein n=1 Tax=Tupaia chinensis TaxID=246437 RepID=UPI000703FB25|nr:kappa-casein [Tupaia chinensis]